MNEKYDVLHLDDNPDITERMEKLFIDIDLNYRYAHTIKDTWKLLKERIPDLLIVDLMLEDNGDATTGANFIKNVSKIFTDLKIMVLSARGDQSLRKDLEEYVTFFETKIFKPSTYKEKIVFILENGDRKLGEEN